MAKSRARKRARKLANKLARERLLEKAPERPWTAQDILRILSRYRSMRGRGGVELSFVPIGPRVDATTPEELERATEEAWLAEALKQEPS